MPNSLNAKKLFLIDSLGALISAFMLGIILTTFESVFGMPKKILYYLAFIAFMFFVNSLWCFLAIKENWKTRMKFIAIGNVLYCGLTASLVIFNYQKLTVLGLTYFVLEITIVVTLTATELKTTYSLKHK